jgi:hypothetical protein
MRKYEVQVCFYFEIYSRVAGKVSRYSLFGFV